MKPRAHLPWVIAVIAALHAAGADFAGNAPCAECHAEIAAAYRRSAMARSSGEVDQLPAGEFWHPGSGTLYVMADGEMTFRKKVIEGRRRLPYFLGAGGLARSYLIETDGYLFQAPVTYYARAKQWDLSPGYEGYETVPLNRPVEPECLACHAGRLQSVPATQNRYRGRPFLEDGIGCERCHGPAGEHVRRKGRGAIVNPAKLDAKRRDSVCGECHLGGAVRIFRPGRRPGSFLPGEPLTDYAAVFRPSAGHMEQLWDSACKKASGDRLWCGTCHDSHSGKAAGPEKCLTCHGPDDCGRGRDCLSCHMLKAAVRSIPHSAYTDHTIPRTPRPTAEPIWSLQAIRPFWSDGASDRETGLALAKIGIQRGKPELFAHARELLQPLEENLDGEALLHLAVLCDREGDEERAAVFYQRSLRLDPALAEAAVNLGAILAARGDIGGAMKLWRDALTRNPGLEAASIKLASAYWLRGEREAAWETLRRARLFLPELR